MKSLELRSCIVNAPQKIHSFAYLRPSLHTIQPHMQWKYSSYCSFFNIWLKQKKKKNKQKKPNPHTNKKSSELVWLIQKEILK